MAKPQYDVQIHSRANKELNNITAGEGDELKQRLRELKHYESPTGASYVTQMEDHTELFAVRVDGFRALCMLSKPTIYILLVDKRRSVYSRIDVAKTRGGLE